MKTTILPKLVMAATWLMVIFITVSDMKAQTPSTCGPYDVWNNLQCNIIVSYSRSCSNGTCPPSTSGTNVTINASTKLTIPACSGCSGSCDVTITLISVGGTSVGSGITVNSNNTEANFTTTCPWGGGDMMWGPGATMIN